MCLSACPEGDINEVLTGISKIEQSKYSGCTNLKGNLIIPDTVVSIGNYAFSNCTGFTGSLVIPPGVTSIGSYAFSNCTGFNGSLVLTPSSYCRIGNNAFEGCSGFTGPLVISYDLSLGANAFQNWGVVENDITIGIDFIEANFWSNYFSNTTFTGSLIMDSNVIGIGAYAFEGCSGFTGSLVIPSSVSCLGSTNPLPFPDTYFNNLVFSNWGTVENNLTIGIINIPNNFWSNYFSNTTFTGSLILNSSVTGIGAYAFEGCSGFTGSLEIPSSVLSIGTYAFSNWGTAEINLNIGIINIPNNFWSNYFSNTTFTGSLVLSSGATIIGMYAFYGCSGFTGSLEISSGVTNIQVYAFYGCSGFTGPLTIPSSVSSIDMYAFYGCSGFTDSLKIPSSVTSIHSCAFCGCSGFKGSLVIPSSVIIIGESAFRYWGTVENSLTIGITDIPNNFWNNFLFNTAFKGRLILNSSVRSIGSSAFYGCNAFNGSLEIPSSVTSIGLYAFYGCTGFSEKLTFYSDNTITIDQYAFANTKMNKINVISANINEICSKISFDENISITVPENYKKTTFCGIKIGGYQCSNNARKKSSNHRIDVLRF